MESRPGIETIQSGKELKRWYWRKDELVPYARSLGLKTNSGKFIILDRIAHFLDTGEKLLPTDGANKSKSRFNWQTEILTDATPITDNYKNTQNVRKFFQTELGADFKFNLALMDWMKDNVGRTLGDACQAYKAIKEQEKIPGFKTKIKSHNQFNQYTRDFLEDNPELGMSDVRRIWALKIKCPSDDGRHIYKRSDLSLSDKNEFSG